jgi:hypothetical protein
MAKIENEFVKVFKKRTKKFAIDTLNLKVLKRLNLKN